MQLKRQAMLATLALLSPAAFAATTACESLTGLKIPGYDVSIKQAAAIPAGPPPASPFGPPPEGTLPAYCRVDGTIDERTGADGKPYAFNEQEAALNFLYQAIGKVAPVGKAIVAARC